MNHQISINNKRYVVRQQSQKILLLSFPSLTLIQKFYINANFSTINRETKQLLIINKNEVTIIKVALMPLQFVIRQQSFVQWEPIGGILMANAIILYSNHAIVFYNRGNLVEKSWQIDIVQQIECLKSTQGGDCIAMKVKSPDNSLFLWNTGDPSIKPFQEIILTQSIIQWNFISKEILTILTASELRIYRRDDKSPQFNLYHFYKIAYKTFTWVNQTALAPPNKQSVRTITLLGKKGQCSVLELLATEKRTENSQTRQLGKIQLQYKQIKMKRIIAAWGQQGKLALICQTANHALYSFIINDMLKIQYSKAFQDLLGAQINFASCYGNLVLVRDKTRWKLFQLSGQSSLKCFDQVDCEKAFIIDETSLLCLDKQTIQLRTIHKMVGEPIPLKYSDPSKVQYIGHNDHCIFLVVGIRFYRWGQGGLSAVGFSLRNERAQLLQVNTFQKTILYQVGEQYLLLRYRIDGQKVAASSLKSSPNYCCALSSNFWAQKLQNQIKVGSGEQIITTFSLNRLLKILQCQNQLLQYSFSSTDGNGLVIIIKNYVFFLELVEDEKGYQIVLLKRMNNLLYRRFSPHFKNIKLIDPQSLTFWMGNCIIRTFSKINQHLPSDPFSLPETVKAKQLQLRKTFPPHHPRLLISLIESNRFQVLFLVINKIYQWFQKGAQFKQLYKIFDAATLKDCAQSAKIDSLSLFSEQRLQQQQVLFKKFAEEILQDSQKIQLKQKNPLIFQSILSALSNIIPNAKSYDYFTQSIMLLHRTPLRKNSFNSMNIALLSHSLNKEEALAELRFQKGQKLAISWQWIKNLSLPLWYDNKQQLKKMIEQVATIEYRSTKDPFNCLFWYLLIGKKSLIATLFKNHKLISKEHDATANFLLRDFSQPKDRTAAVKNAYVLLDKKRYFHALSFFILGNSIDDCVRICLDRLKDLSLAYTFILFFKDTNNSYFFSQLAKGDMWMKHISYKLQSQHIKSYNALYDTAEPLNWGYSLDLAGFHPILPQFSVKLRGSVGVRRQLDAQTAKSSYSQDIFADFYGSEEEKPAQQNSTKITLQGDPSQFKQRVIRYYLRQGLPLLSLLEDDQSKEALEYYTYQKYKLSGLVDQSVKDLVEKLQDKPNLVKCLLSSKKYDELIAYLKLQIKQFNDVISPLSFSIVIDTKKNLISDIIRFSQQAQIILVFIKQSNDANLETQDVKKILQEIKIIVNFSKVLICLLLNHYEELSILLQNIKKNRIDFQTRQIFWSHIKPLYDNYYELQKQKTIKQMDHFEHAFIAVRRRQQQEDLIRSDMQITKQQCGILILRLLVLNHLLRAQSNFREPIEKMKKQIKHVIDNWIDKQQLYDIHHEFKVLIKEGTQSKLKLNLLKTVFEEHFVQFYDIVALTHQGYFETKAVESQSVDKSQQLQAIEVFRNRQDGLRNFVINQYDSRGLEVIVMFKKGLKKIEVCENLVSRERSKQNLSLAVEDSFYTTLSNIDPRSLEGNRYEPPIRKAISHILQQKIESGFPRSFISYSGKEYIRQVQAPYLDYNELNSIECHQSLPFFFIGGKGNVEVAHLSTLKNFDRIKCPLLGEIVKLHSCGQRIGVADSSGNLGVHILDHKFTNNCVFSLKKANVVDFSFLRASLLAVLSSNAVQVYDTLLHPKRQLKFKQPFTKDPLAISAIDQTRIAVLRKNEVLIYDTRMQKLQGARELKGKGKSMLIQGKNIYVGQSDGKVKVFSLYNEENQTIKLGLLDEKDRQKTSVQELRSYGSILLASTSEGSIFYLPKVQ